VRRFGTPTSTFENDRVMTTFAVKEIFLTLQGEGANVGRPAVFCRFAGCNLWSGRESDRADAVCKFCDTDFVGTNGTKGGRYRSADELAAAVEAEWTGGAKNRLCVLTGGEPLLQVDDALIKALHDRGFEIAIETNGTIAPPAGIDWICVSPKSTSELVIRQGNELKLVYPQHDALPEKFAHLAFDNFLLQPMDSVDVAANMRGAIQYCLDNPQWRLSVQTHKHIGIR
jgi:7-carboxy-7-deazaguanine synthase (Cx14CxxC type)